MMMMDHPPPSTNKYNSSDDDSEDEDDLADIPDTREYMPLDMEGLHALGIGGGGGVGKGKEDGKYSMEDLQNMTMNNDELLDDEEEEEEDDDEDDVNDIQLRDTDALLVLAKTEEDYASLEINIFDTTSSNLYVHHDIPLPSFPLCLALGSAVPSLIGSSSSSSNSENENVSAGNFVAVGSFEPGIEIWNLDVMNALEPTVVLGGMDTRGMENDWMGMKSSKKKSSNSKEGGLRKGSHTDAIMALSWNTVHQQVLASASADCTVKLWDVTSSKGEYIQPSATLTHHSDKVISLAWHPSEGTLLATGSYDRQVCLVDARSAAAVASNGSTTTANANVKKAKLLADCEAIAWDPHNQHYLTAASEDGVVRCWDVRKFSSDPVWSVVAHEYGVSDICYNSQVAGMLVTCSVDKTVALWDTRKSIPEPCGSKEMNVGKLYSVRTYPSSPWLLACGGSGNQVAIWDMEAESAIQKRFAKGNADDIDTKEGEDEPDFEAIMANEDNGATMNATNGKNAKKKKGSKSKKKGKGAHKKR